MVVVKGGEEGREERVGRGGGWDLKPDHSTFSTDASAESETAANVHNFNERIIKEKRVERRMQTCSLASDNVV